MIRKVARNTVAAIGALAIAFEEVVLGRDIAVCPECGTSYDAEIIVCSSCGVEVDEMDHYPPDDMSEKADSSE